MERAETDTMASRIDNLEREMAHVRRLLGGVGALLDPAALIPAELSSETAQAS